MVGEEVMELLALKVGFILSNLLLKSSELISVIYLRKNRKHFLHNLSDLSQNTNHTCFKTFMSFCIYFA